MSSSEDKINVQNFTYHLGIAGNRGVVPDTSGPDTASSRFVFCSWRQQSPDLSTKSQKPLHSFSRPDQDDRKTEIKIAVYY